MKPAMMRRFTTWQRDVDHQHHRLFYADSRPFDFGRIAATNAISDIFAMGGKPIMAIAILGWPINTLAPEIAREVVDGRFACQQAGSPWRAATRLTRRSRFSVWRSPAWCRPSGSRKTAPPRRAANSISPSR
jgi:selenide,water dikinase